MVLAGTGMGLIFHTRSNTIPGIAVLQVHMGLHH